MIKLDKNRRIKRLRIVVGCLLTLLLFHAPVLVAQENIPDTIVFGSDNNFPPYEFLDKEGNPAGFNVDLIRAIAKEMGFKVKVKLGVWTDIKKEFTEKKTIQITDMYYLKSREDTVDYAIPHEVNYDEIYIQKSQSGISSIENLRNKRVAVLSGSTIEEHIIRNYPGIILISVPSEPEALSLLSKGGCDAAIVSRIISFEALRKLKIKNLVSIGRPIFPRELSFVVLKGNTKLLNLINAGIVRLKENGEFDKLREKWIVRSSESWLDRNLLIVSSIFLSLVLIVFIWIRGLRFTVKKRTAELEKRTNELEFINDRLKQISKIKSARVDKYSIKEQTDESLEQIRTAFKSDACAIQLLVKGELQLQGSVGIKSLQIQEALTIDSFLIQKIFKTHKAMAMSAAEFSNAKLKKTEKLILSDKQGSFAAAPLLVEGNITGILELYVNSKKVIFNNLDLEHLQIVANQIGISTENTRLFEQNEKQKEILVKQIVSRKKAEDEIKQLNVELEQRVQERTTQLEVANKELEAFSYSVSHDLRAPLRGIDGFSLALFEDYNELLDDTAKDYISRIRNATKKMDGLIDSLLRLSRISRQEMNFTEVDLSNVVKEISKHLKETDSKRKVQFIIQESITVFGDLNLLKIAFENLLNNAWKFTSKKEKTVIEFGARQEDSKTTYFVKDNGVGFDNQYAHKLFSAFQRLHSEKDYPGTGVGLTTVQRIIHRHNGEIWAESELNKGTIFYFTI